MAKISKNEVRFDNMVYGVLEHDVESHNNDEGLEAEVHDGQVRGNVVLVGDEGVEVQVHNG